ncbi:hypothetical protein HYN59_15485 [Flavobacterium album]|uniref:PKD domain-containing protein n=1 Tax=Flavobacterium album TaxID=2175091 RepID=A0A2S1R1D5_9FLAO|nr:gliding motility-associated C-terminal domain-containing protein [Flavobacterium album]AWH86422.1 hypothetical protein HYN59_15485 [Flavobacterium album]
MKKIYVLMLAILTQAVFAQKETNIWYFGLFAGVDFNSGEPVALYDGQIDTSEGSSCIADAQGNLLFYTDGVTVYNRQHQVMENGTGLMGNTSSTQGVLITGGPGSATKYYIFTVGAVENPVGLNYSEVNMAANGGLGAVTANKNINLLDSTTEGITATLHENGEDIWIVVHGYPGDVVYSFLLTENGINEPVVSNVGPFFQNTLHWNDPYFEPGAMKLSADGSRLAVASQAGGVFLCDYDKVTGEATNALQLENGAMEGPYGVEFSLSGNVLYTARTGKLRQYNLLAADIATSGTVVYEDPYFTLGALQLASNGKIYKPDGLSESLSVIHNPEVLGTGCNFEWGSVYLGSQRFAELGLPTAIASYFVGPDIEAQHFCAGSETAFSVVWNRSPQEANWDFGDGTSSAGNTAVHTYTAAGTYTVKVTLKRNGFTWEIEKQVIINAIPQFSLPEVLATCDPQNEVIQLTPENFDISAASFQWFFNDAPLEAITPTLQPSGFGVYKVTVAVNGCENTRTIHIIEKPAFGVTVAESCNNGSFTLEALPLEGSFDPATAAFSWEGPDSFAANAGKVFIAKPGEYSVAVETQEGCRGSMVYNVVSANCNIQRGISPNLDGRNDYFDLAGFDIEELSVFNRYGLKVYNRKHYTTEWSGQSDNGEALPDGTYYYVIKTVAGQPKTGWVYINREEH